MRFLYFNKLLKMWPKTNNLMSLRKHLNIHEIVEDQYLSEVEALYRCAKHPFGRYKIENYIQKKKLTSEYNFIEEVVGLLISNSNNLNFDFAHMNNAFSNHKKTINIQQIAESYANNLCNMDINLISITLYGSYANGNTTNSSDVDFIIFVPSENDYRRELQGVFFQAWPLSQPMIDYLVVTPKDFESLKQQGVTNEFVKTSKIIWQQDA